MTSHSAAPARMGGCLCQVNFVIIKALDRLYTLGPFGLKNLKCAFPWWGLCLEIEEKKTCFGKILMTVREQGKCLSATLLVMAPVLSWVPIYARHITWLFLLHFLKWILDGVLFKIRLLNVYVINRGLDRLHHQEVYFTVIKLCFK